MRGLASLRSAKCRAIVASSNALISYALDNAIEVRDPLLDALNSRGAYRTRGCSVIAVLSVLLGRLMILKLVTQLRALDDITLAGRTASAHHGNHVPEPDAQLKGPFWEVLKRITVHGYYTSEIGFTKELKLEIIPGAQHGCAPATGSQGA